jgi:rRNA maturation endonuclease Nob1
MAEQSNWIETITRIYREALAESGTEGADRQEVLMVAGARVATEIKAGRLGYTLDSFIQSELIKVDESDGKKADAIIREAATGQGVFDITEATLDVVVTLGAGRRKLWRDVTADDLTTMNEVRFRNYRSVKASYEEWFKYFRAVREVVVEFETFGAAVVGGGFPPAQSATAAA